MPKTKVIFQPHVAAFYAGLRGVNSDSPKIEHRLPVTTGFGPKAEQIRISHKREAEIRSK